MVGLAYRQRLVPIVARHRGSGLPPARQATPPDTLMGVNVLTGDTDTDTGTQTPWVVRISGLDTMINEWLTLAIEEHSDYDVRKVIATVVEARHGHMDGHWAVEARPLGGNESQWTARWNSIENTVTTRVWEHDTIIHELTTPYVSPDRPEGGQPKLDASILALDPEAQARLNAWLEEQLENPDSPLARAAVIALGRAIPSRLECSELPADALSVEALSLLEALQVAQTHSAIFHSHTRWWECRRSVWTVLSAARELATAWNVVTPDRSGPCPH